MRRTDEGLRAVLDPADRATEASGQVGDADVFRERLTFGPKSATYIGYDHPDLLVGHLEYRRQVSLQPVRSLVRAPDGEPAVVLRLRQERPGLHRGRDESLLAVAGLDHNGGVLPHLLIYRFADARLVDYVAQAGEQLGRPLLRRFGGIEDRR